MTEAKTIPEYIIIGFRHDGKIFAHRNTVSNALYVYTDLKKADKKAYEIEAKSKKLNFSIDCMVVELRPVIS